MGRSERIASTEVIAGSIVSALCKQVTGMTCSAGDKVVVKKFCGEDVDVEKTFLSGSRRLPSVDDDAIVNYTFFSQSLNRDELKKVESMLSSYLQGNTLTSFLAAVLSEILARNPPLARKPTAIYYTAQSAFITGLGLYYPAWGYSETCLSDGNQDTYMNQNHVSWLYGNLDSCCQRYFGWDTVGCRLRNAEMTLISGTIPDTVDPTDALYFPDWRRTNTCIN